MPSDDSSSEPRGCIAHGGPDCICDDEPPMTPEEEEASLPDSGGAPPPPQPERRPPLTVAYSVNGHLYEVAVSGDAAVRAVDGALIIQHHLGPVAGIVQVMPLIPKEGAHGADAEE